MERDNGLARYSDGDRSNHWLLVICFFVVGLTGLAFFHPSMYFLTHLFGGGPWARILHPFFGVAMFLLFIGMMIRFWGHNRLNDSDREWLKRWRDVIANREEGVPEPGRYNAGQKVIFWIMVGSMLVLLATGVVFWRPYFADAFSITAIRVATLLHAIAAVVLIVSMIVHVYAAFWVKGALRGMMRGTVARGWARKHHGAWYKEVTGSK
jgi:formate dehydrogenase subunit gamma